MAELPERLILKSGSRRTLPAHSVSCLVSGAVSVESHRVPTGSLIVLAESREVLAETEAVCQPLQFPVELNISRDDILSHGKPVHAAAKLHYELGRSLAGKEWVVQGLLLELAGYIQRLQAVPADPRPEVYVRAIDAIERRLGESISLNTIAEELGLLPRQLSRILREESGFSFRDLVRRRRLDAACRMIVFEDRPLGEIAVSTGFADQAHFAREFKRIIGVPPSQYHPERGAEHSSPDETFKTSACQ